MKIKFVPQNIEFEATPNKSVLQVAIDNKIDIKSFCKGKMTCAECRVKIVSGEQNVIPPSKTEMGVIGTSYYIDGRRLSCQIRCFGDVTIDMSEQIERSEVQTKKIRGFKSKRQIESHAILDTLILNEKLPDPHEKKK